MSSPDESAERVLEGVLGHKEMSFSQFRTAMYSEHPTFLSDDELHDLYVKHVMKVQVLEVGPIVDFLDKAIPPSSISDLAGIYDHPSIDIEATRREAGLPPRTPRSIEQDLLNKLTQRLNEGRPLPKSAQKPIRDWDQTIADAAGNLASKARQALKILREHRSSRDA